MANIYVSDIGVPRKPRNKRIYGGNSFVFTNVNSGGGGVAKHWEVGTIEDLTSVNVIVYFGEAFSKLPTMVQLKVYRMVEFETNKWLIQDVLFYQASNDGRPYNEYGFGLVIDSNEDLTGIIIEYAFA